MTEGNYPELSIVIPTWNGWDLLQQCLESLRNQSFQDFEVVVVDDGSTDDTPNRLASAWPGVRCVACPANRGFAPAVNAGIAVARGTWVFLLNNDVTLEPPCLELLMKTARESSHSMLCPLVFWAEDPRFIYSAGDALLRNGRPASRGFRRPRDSYTPSCDPFGVSGGYGLFRKALLDEVGVLDERFVAYFEDADLCFRARWAGHTAALVPEAVAHHVGSASIEGKFWWRTRQCFQNHALLVVKNYSAPLLWRNRGAIVRERRHQWARVFNTARSEWGLLRAAAFTFFAWWGLLRRLPGALRDRRGILRGRKLDIDAMQRLLAREDDAHGL